MTTNILAVGIDPSLAATAVAMPGVPIRTFSSPACGPRVLDRFERYARMVLDIRSHLLTHRGDRRVVVAIEGYSFGSNMPGANARVEFGTLLRQALVFLNVEVWEVPPSTLKKHACGSGKPGKAGIVSALSSRYQIQFGSDDEADAFGLMIFAQQIAGIEEPLNQSQRDTLNAVMVPKAKARKQRAMGA
jgi:Holliday junction resolvasome RuvABC endonuclease subunit